jgi:hypothetical protein
MTSTFSWETKILLDRADRAIERSMKLREESARELARARRWILYVEMNLCRSPDETSRKETAQSC